jgi:hypothetical protein
MSLALFLLRSLVVFEPGVYFLLFLGSPAALVIVTFLFVDTLPSLSFLDAILFWFF